MEDNSSTYRHRILVADDEKSIADASSVFYCLVSGVNLINEIKKILNES